MNYYLENYISPILKDAMKERSLRAVRKTLENE